MDKHEELIPLHSHQLKQHDELLAKFSDMPAIISGMKESIALLTMTLDRINERLDKTQSKDACTDVHRALEILRMEQLGNARADISDHEKKLCEHAIKHENTDKEISEMRGVIRFLKWAIPASIAVAPGVAVVVIHVYGK
jgi:hypothetical protein